MAEDNEGVQRSLGRIEGAQEQILNTLQEMRETFGAHTTEDAIAFKALGARLNSMQSERDRVKGAGYVVLTVLGAFATFVGSAVIAVFSGYIKLH